MKRIHPLVARLAQVRKAAGLSARQASLLAGLSPNVVAGWETGRREPTVHALEAYAAVFGLRLLLADYVTETVYADAVRRLELETTPARPPHDDQGLPPITTEAAAENRRLLAEALGLVDHDLQARGKAA